MYGKRRIVIGKNGEISISGKHPGDQGGSHQMIGRLQPVRGGVGVYLWGGRLVATVPTRKNRVAIRQAIHAAACNSDTYYLGQNDVMLISGKLTR
jgi:hypothetical protein